MSYLYYLGTVYMIRGWDSFQNELDPFLLKTLYL